MASLATGGRDAVFSGGGGQASSQAQQPVAPPSPRPLSRHFSEPLKRPPSHWAETRRRSAEQFGEQFSPLSYSISQSVPGSRDHDCGLGGLVGGVGGCSFTAIYWEQLAGRGMRARDWA